MSRCLLVLACKKDNAPVDSVDEHVVKIFEEVVERGRNEPCSAEEVGDIIAALSTLASLAQSQGLSTFSLKIMDAVKGHRNRKSLEIKTLLRASMVHETPNQQDQQKIGVAKAIHLYPDSAALWTQLGRASIVWSAASSSGSLALPAVKTAQRCILTATKLLSKSLATGGQEVQMRFGDQYATTFALEAALALNSDDDLQYLEACKKRLLRAIRQYPASKETWDILGYFLAASGSSFSGHFWRSGRHDNPGRLTLQKTEDYPAAISHYEQAIESTPEDPSAWFELACLNDEKQHLDENKELLQRWYHLLEDENLQDSCHTEYVSFVLSMLSMTFYKTGEFDEGLTWVERLCSRNPQSAVAQMFRAMYNIKLQKQDIAQKSYDKARQLNSQAEAVARLLALDLMLRSPTKKSETKEEKEEDKETEESDGSYTNDGDGEDEF
uniref:Uncharacterized protein n=1 Tax=Heterosigma akashiwo TaxID=2829 RepID=A0A7S3XYH0_HETAK